MKSITDGFIRVPGGWLEYRLAPGKTCEIVNIEVDSDRRRTGVGKGMLCQLESLPGVRVVYAFTSADNCLAQSWYMEMGFVLTLAQKFYGDTDAYLCVKVVNPRA